MDVKIDETWKKNLQEEFDKPYFENIVHHLKQKNHRGK
jgi:uracil-DNA glycosylase